MVAVQSGGRSVTEWRRGCLGTEERLSRFGGAVIEAWRCSRYGGAVVAVQPGGRSVAVRGGGVTRCCARNELCL